MQSLIRFELSFFTDSILKIFILKFNRIYINFLTQEYQVGKYFNDNFFELASCKIIE